MAAGRRSVFWPDQFANPGNAEAHQLGDRAAVARLRSSRLATASTGSSPPWAPAAPSWGCGRAVRERFTAATNRARRRWWPRSSPTPSRAASRAASPGSSIASSALLDVRVELAWCPTCPVTHDEALATTRELCSGVPGAARRAGSTWPGPARWPAQLGPGCPRGHRALRPDGALLLDQPLRRRADVARAQQQREVAEPSAFGLLAARCVTSSGACAGSA